MLAILCLLLIYRQDLQILDENLSSGQDSKIKYEIFPYGQYPIGKEIIGKLVLSRSNLCKENQEMLQSEEGQVFLLTNSTGCQVKRKTQFAEQEGARLLIIQLEQNETFKEALSKFNSYDYSEIGIPTIAITYLEGTRLRELILQNKEVVLRLRIPIKQESVTQLSFFVHPKSLTMIEFILSLKDHLRQFKDSVKIDFNFIHQNGYFPQDLAGVQIYLNCVPQYWDYQVLESFYESCFSKNQYKQECIIQTIHRLSIKNKDQIRKCAIERMALVQDVTNEIVGRKDQNEYIFINKRQYIGSLAPEAFFESVCGSFLETPKVCLFLQNKYSVYLNYDKIVEERLQSKKSKKRALYFVTFLLLISGGILIYIIYEKTYRLYLENNIENIVRQSMGTYEAIEN